MSRFAAHRHRSVMRLDDRLDQTQAKPEATLRTAFVAAIEALPNPGLFVGWNPGPSVTHSHAHQTLSGDRADDHAPAFGRVLERVVEKVAECLSDPVPIHLRRARR